MREIYLGIIAIVAIMAFMPFSLAALGVSPASYTIDFQPGLKQVFSFDFFNDMGNDFEIYATGDFAENVELSTGKIEGGNGRVNALLILPDSTDIPGTRKLFIGAKEKIEAEAGIGISGNVRGVIFIKVPYPGKYAETRLTVSDANVGDDVQMELFVENKGTEAIETDSYVELFDSQNNSVGTIDFGQLTLKPTESTTFNKNVSTKDYGSGDYLAISNVQYDGKVSKKNAYFRLGRLYLEVINYTQEVERAKINKFHITVKSYWNNGIDNVYSDVYINNATISFKTPSAYIEKWGTVQLEGYLDTTPIEGEEFDALIRLLYEHQSTEKWVKVRFKQETNYTPIAIIAGAALVILFLVWIIYKLKRLENRLSKQNEKRK